MNNPGQLNKRITLQDLTTSVDAYGSPTDVWTDVCTIWAGIFPLSGRNFFEAEMVNSEVSHKINIRYRSGIKPDMRVKFGSRYFHIISVINFQEGNKDMQMMCKELIK